MRLLLLLLLLALPLSAQSPLRPRTITEFSIGMQIVRFSEEERRYTEAIEIHPSPLGIVWGDLDPIAVHAMALRLAEVRADARLVTLDGVGHYPMVEAPERFAAAVSDLLTPGATP